MGSHTDVGIEERLDSVVDGLMSVLARAQRAALVASLRPAPVMRFSLLRSWHEGQLDTEGRFFWSSVPDLTAGRDDACAAASSFTLDGERHDVVCTRRAGHTRRHACGVAGRIVAVWQVAP